MGLSLDGGGGGSAGGTVSNRGDVGVENGPTLVGVLAHPDDEMGFGAVLAQAAHEGARVRLVALTAGQKGFRPHHPVTDGEELVRVRTEEFRNASRILGLDPPLVLEFVDQELLGDRQDEIQERLSNVLTELRPDVVVTFGPDGITGHPDHRAVSCFVTEILQARQDGPRLYYHGLHPWQAARFAERTGRTFRAVAEPYLTTRIRVSGGHLERGLKAIGEYRSQFSAPVMDQLLRAFRETTRDVWFRRVFPHPGSRGDLEDSLFP